jgi:mannosyl-oligosaccharide alpha-1,2-mannosidase
MFAIGGALFNIQIHRQIAHKLVDGCVWAHNAMPLGIMPEIYETIPCASQKTCPWNEWHWKQEVYKWTINQPDSNPNLDVEKYIREQHLPKGFIAIPDTRYNLRPETIESIFVLYRVTGRENLLDIAWELFEKIQNATETSDANAALADVTTNGEPVHNDFMESYWMAQTLKYFYLIFSPPDVLSLDEYVFNSCGHPLRISEQTEAGFEPE